ncbi:hypothetical protein GCM10007392_36830 [Saccharospirillum salsuginis]|uniref:Uncharacterized protein n=1 Tax=Saccharospirillum salsuginis TaxID=418750 RepID=A0A918KJT5_9GAMM|nr:hypothetical protein GCM10007392_36830 [Saccharospirillum salsuginis]
MLNALLVGTVGIALAFLEWVLAFPAMRLGVFIAPFHRLSNSLGHLWGVARGSVSSRTVQGGPRENPEPGL